MMASKLIPRYVKMPEESDQNLVEIRQFSGVDLQNAGENIGAFQAGLRRMKRQFCVQKLRFSDILHKNQVGWSISHSVYR